VETNEVIIGKKLDELLQFDSPHELLEVLLGKQTEAVTLDYLNQVTKRDLVVFLV